MPLPIQPHPPASTLTALALLRAAQPDASEQAALYALAVAACWDGPLPWHAENAQKAAAKQQEARALQGWLDRLPPSNDPANRAEADAGRLDLSRLKAEIRALESPRFSIPLGLVAAATEGERALSAFLAHGFPLLAIVQAGQDILSKAESLLMAGYAEFSQLDAAGFSKATTGSPSAVASYSPPVTEAMPSAGLK